MKIIKVNTDGPNSIFLANKDEDFIFNVDGETKKVRGPMHVFEALKLFGRNRNISWEGKKEREENE